MCRKIHQTVREDWYSILFVSLFSATLGVAGYALIHSMLLHPARAGGGHIQTHSSHDR